jgi:hypothetical protein
VVVAGRFLWDLPSKVLSVAPVQSRMGSPEYSRRAHSFSLEKAMLQLS